MPLILASSCQGTLYVGRCLPVARPAALHKAARASAASSRRRCRPPGPTVGISSCCSAGDSRGSVSAQSERCCSATAIARPRARVSRRPSWRQSRICGRTMPLQARRRPASCCNGSGGACCTSSGRGRRRCGQSGPPTGGCGGPESCGGRYVSGVVAGPAAAALRIV